MHVFVSYKHEDSDFAENVMSRLEKAGFQTWADHKIGAGEEWRNAIDLAIKNSFALIVIMTPEAKTSEYVTYEWAFAWGVGIRVIPVLLKKTELHPRLEALQHLDFTNRMVRPWDRLLEEIRAASHAPLAHTIRIPLNTPPFVRQAVIALDSASSGERKDAIETLTQLWKMPEVCGVLIEALKHPITDVRSNAARVLGQIKDPSVVPALLDALHDPDKTVRSHAAWSLGETKDPSVVPALLDTLLHDPDETVRSSAAWSLDKFNDPSVVPALLDTLLHDSGTNVRSHAAWALGRIKDHSTVPALLDALRDPIADVRSNAAKVLGQIKDPSAVPALLDALLHDSDKSVRSNAAKVLGQIKDPSIIPVLLNARRDPDETVRSHAEWALKKIIRSNGGTPVA